MFIKLLAGHQLQELCTHSQAFLESAVENHKIGEKSQIQQFVH